MLIFHPTEFRVPVFDRHLAQGHCQSAGSWPAQPPGHQRDQTLGEKIELAATTLV